MKPTAKIKISLALVGLLISVAVYAANSVNQVITGASQTFVGTKVFNGSVAVGTELVAGSLTLYENGYAFNTGTGGAFANVDPGSVAYGLPEAGRIGFNGTAPTVYATFDGTTLTLIGAPVQTDNLFKVLNNGDSTGSPGNAEINGGAGRSAVAAGAASVTITNDQVVSTYNVFITPLTDTANCRGAYVSTIGNGSFVVTCPGGTAGANWSFQWWVLAQ